LLFLFSVFAIDSAATVFALMSNHARVVLGLNKGLADS
jgi:hypothetical protein